MRTWRLASRLARREVRRRPIRTALVAILVGVPVGATAVGAVIVRTAQQTPMSEWRLQNGRADATTYGTDESLKPTYPAGARVVEYQIDYRLLRVAGTTLRNATEVSDVPMTDPLVAETYKITTGRAPVHPGEVFLGRIVAKHLHVKVGDHLTLDRPARMTLLVTGVGERRASWSYDEMIVTPGTAFPWSTERMGRAWNQIVDLPAGMTTAQLDALATSGNGVRLAPGLGTEAESGPRRTPVAWSWVFGAAVLTVVGIVIASAFAAGARRQLTTLGQLAANGADPSTLRATLLLQGTWTGAIGAIVGAGFMVGGLVALAPHIDRFVGRDLPPYVVRVGDLLPIAFLGILASTIAALVPARTNARVPVLAALAGRRPLRPVPGWLPVVGTIVVAAGLALLGLAVTGANGGGSGNVWTATAIVGGIAVLLGACTVAPAYVSVLEPVGRRVSGAWRLAARALARQRTRSGAVVSALCATSAFAVAVSALTLSAVAHDRNGPRWIAPTDVHAISFVAPEGPVPDNPKFAIPTPGAPPAAIVAEVTRRVSGAKEYDVSVGTRADGDVWTIVKSKSQQSPDIAIHGGPFSMTIAIADPASLAAYRLTAADRRALDVTGAVLFGSGRGQATIGFEPKPAFDGSGGRVSIGPSGKEAVPAPTAPVDGPAPTDVFNATIVDDSHYALGFLPHLIVTESTAARLHLRPTAGMVVLRAPHALTRDQRASLAEYADELRFGDQAASFNADVQWEQPSGGPSPFLLEALLAGISMVFTLFVIAVSLALAAAETRDERDVLAVLGASPGTMRRTSARQAVILTVLGAALAIPVGFLPVIVFTSVSSSDLPLRFPWRVAVLLLVAIPAIVAAVTSTASAIALRIKPTHVSTMAFD